MSNEPPTTRRSRPVVTHLEVDSIVRGGHGDGNRPGPRVLGRVDHEFPELRFAKADWSPLNDANDHSHGTNTTYADSTRVTAYVDGRRVWRNEP
jgi:hypothetical protein